MTAQNRPDVARLANGPDSFKRAWNNLAASVEGLYQGFGGRSQNKGLQAAPLVSMIVVEIHEDYLICVPADFTGAPDLKGGFTPVAFPYLARRLASRDGQTFTYPGLQLRDANDGSETENQQITPTYVLGDQVMAQRCRHGSGLETEVFISSVSQGTIHIPWVDANVDGRAWAKISS